MFFIKKTINNYQDGISYVCSPNAELALRCFLRFEWHFFNTTCSPVSVIWDNRGGRESVISTTVTDHPDYIYRHFYIRNSLNSYRKSQCALQRVPHYLKIFMKFTFLSKYNTALSQQWGKMKNKYSKCNCLSNLLITITVMKLQCISLKHHCQVKQSMFFLKYLKL